MKELFDLLAQGDMRSPLAQQTQYLIDTCFFYEAFAHHEKEFIEFCKNNAVGITSFNVEEVLFHSHDVNHHIRNRIRSAIKENLNLVVIQAPVSPGDPIAEKEFIEKYDQNLINLIPDPSDAVLAAVASSIGAHVITRDKHHLFTTQLENYFNEKGLKVLNNIPK